MDYNYIIKIILTLIGITYGKIEIIFIIVIILECNCNYMIIFQINEYNYK